MKMGGGPKQFGLDVEVVPEALAFVASAGLVFEGFHLCVLRAFAKRSRKAMSWRFVWRSTRIRP